jgi:glycosyltransferase involved in cell wall biosynthesis
VKVLHLTDDLGLLGGVQRYLENLRTILPEQGVECLVWAPEPRPLGDMASRWYGRRSRAEVREMIRRERPDAVHAHNVWMRLSPAPLAAAREAGVPVLVTAHDYGWVCPRKWMITGRGHPCELGFGGRCALSGCRGSREGPAWLPYNALRWFKTAAHRAMARRWVDRFISPSQHLAGWLVRSLRVDDVAHVPNFAVAPRRGTPGPVVNPQNLVFAGRLSREKGVDVLLRAMPQIVAKFPQARLVVAGEGPERASLEDLTTEVGIAGSVQFAGTLSPERLEDLYADAGLVVLPTLWMENCPVSVLEAFANGRAVAASRVGGVPELIDDGRNGILFERADHRDLGSRLAAAMARPDGIVAMGSRAAARWTESYTPDIHCRRLRAVYAALPARAG